MNYVDRPAFSEGQVLSAAALQLTVDYARDALEEHDAVAHTPGVVDGMSIALQPNVPPATGLAAFVTPGFAIDASGRQIAIATPMPVVSDPIAASPTGPYPVYVWLTEDDIAAGRAFDPCSTANAGRVRERANVAVFSDVATALAQSPDAICLGYVQWDEAARTFSAYTGAAQPRLGSGVRAHVIVAPEHAVTVHAEDDAATAFAVRGTVKAVAAADGSAGAVQLPGSALEFGPADPLPPEQTMSLAYAVNDATGNALVLDLGNDDPNSRFAIQSHAKTVLATIDGTGTFNAAAANVTNVAAQASVTVGSGTNTLALEAVAPSGAVGLAASHSLPLVFGTGQGDVATIGGGATPAVTIDPHALTVHERSVAIGTLDAAAGTAGIATTAGDPLVLRAFNNDVVIAPNYAPLLRFTANGAVLNMAAGACDVTPVTGVGGDHFLFRMGPIAVAYGMKSVTLHPISDTPPAIVFEHPFAIVPAFFVNAFATGKFTVSASATAVSVTGASYKIIRLDPLNPSAGDAASFSGTTVTARVSWVAFGVMG